MIKIYIAVFHGKASFRQQGENVTGPLTEKLRNLSSLTFMSQKHCDLWCTRLKCYSKVKLEGSGVVGFESE